MAENNDKRMKGVCEFCGMVQEVKWVGGMLMCEDCEIKNQKSKNDQTEDKIIGYMGTKKLIRRFYIKDSKQYKQPELIWIEEKMKETQKEQNKQNENKVEISYSIHIDDFPEELIKILLEHNVKFQVWENHELKKEFDDTPEELPVVYIDLEIYNKLKKLCEITGISLEDIANTELKAFLSDNISDEPLIFLDKYLGFKNIKDPIPIIEKMNEVVNLGEDYVAWLKTIDLNAYVDNWNHPLKKLKKI